VFAALTPPATAIDHLQQALHGVRRDDVEWRWVLPDRWHLTLAFYGEVSELTADRVALRLERVAGRQAPLQLCFAGVGAFDRPSRARVIWAGVRTIADDGSLARLADRCRAAGRRAGVTMPQTDRGFRAHLTLARARTNPVDARGFLAALAGYTGPVWTATHLQLIRSFLGPVPRYETLGSWPLSDGAS